MRFQQIDILRGFAALLVTLFHLTGNTGLSATTVAVGSYGWTGVQMFFVISGLVLPYSMHRFNYKIKNFGIFLLKRGLRIYPAYVVAIMISIGIALFTARDIPGAKAIASHFVMLTQVLELQPISPVFWTLFIEFQFYLLVGLIYPLISKNNYLSAIFLLIVSSISTFAPASTVVHWFPFFALGILLFNRKFTFMRLDVFLATLCLQFALIGIYFGPPPLIASIFAVLFIAFVRIREEGKIVKVLLWLGLISYSIYLVHWELGRAAVLLAKRFPIVRDSDFLMVLFGMAVSVLAGFAMYWFIEKPSLKINHKVKY